MSNLAFSRSTVPTASTGKGKDRDKPDKADRLHHHKSHSHKPQSASSSSSSSSSSTFFLPNPAATVHQPLPPQLSHQHYQYSNGSNSSGNNNSFSGNSYHPSSHDSANSSSSFSYTYNNSLSSSSSSHLESPLSPTSTTPGSPPVRPLRVDITPYKLTLVNVLNERNSPSAVSSYWSLIDKFLRAQLSKSELDHSVKNLLGLENLYAHNDFFMAILQNAESDELPKMSEQNKADSTTSLGVKEENKVKLETGINDKTAGTGGAGASGASAGGLDSKGKFVVGSSGSEKENSKAAKKAGKLAKQNALKGKIGGKDGELIAGGVKGEDGEGKEKGRLGVGAAATVDTSKMTKKQLKAWKLQQQQLQQQGAAASASSSAATAAALAAAGAAGLSESSAFLLGHAPLLLQNGGLGLGATVAAAAASGELSDEEAHLFPAAAPLPPPPPTFAELNPAFSHSPMHAIVSLQQFLAAVLGQEEVNVEEEREMEESAMYEEMLMNEMQQEGKIPIPPHRKVHVLQYGSSKRGHLRVKVRDGEDVAATATVGYGWRKIREKMLLERRRSGEEELEEEDGEKDPSASLHHPIAAFLPAPVPYTLPTYASLHSRLILAAHRFGLRNVAPAAVSALLNGMEIYIRECISTTREWKTKGQPTVQPHSPPLDTQLQAPRRKKRGRTDEDEKEIDRAALAVKQEEKEDETTSSLQRSLVPAASPHRVQFSSFPSSCFAPSLFSPPYALSNGTDTSALPRATDSSSITEHAALLRSAAPSLALPSTATSTVQSSTLASASSDTLSSSSSSSSTTPMDTSAEDRSSPPPLQRVDTLPSPLPAKPPLSNGNNALPSSSSSSAAPLPPEPPSPPPVFPFLKYKQPAYQPTHPISTSLSSLPPAPVVEDSHSAASLGLKDILWALEQSSNALHLPELALMIERCIIR